MHFAYSQWRCAPRIRRLATIRGDAGKFSFFTKIPDDAALKLRSRRVDSAAAVPNRGRASVRHCREGGENMCRSGQRNQIVLEKNASLGVNGALIVSVKEEIGAHLQGRARGECNKTLGSSMK
jgi:hypothetical protein